MRAASGRIGDDRIQSLDIEEVEVALSKCPRSLRFTVVSVERSATELNRRRVHFASVCQKNVGGISIDVGEHQVLHATREQADPILDFTTTRAFDWGNELMRELRPDRWTLWLELLNTAREQFNKAEAPKKIL